MKHNHKFSHSRMLFHNLGFPSHYRDCNMGNMLHSNCLNNCNLKTSKYLNNMSSFKYINNTLSLKYVNNTSSSRNNNIQYCLNVLHELYTHMPPSGTRMIPKRLFNHYVNIINKVHIFIH